jgi:hypothetical protein
LSSEAHAGLNAVLKVPAALCAAVHSVSMFRVLHNSGFLKSGGGIFVSHILGEACS